MTRAGKEIISSLRGLIRKLKRGEDIPCRKLRYERVSENLVKVTSSDGTETMVRVAPSGSWEILRDLNKTPEETTDDR